MTVFALLRTFAPRPRACRRRRACTSSKDPSGSVLYVGKAKKLRARVSSYFNRGPRDSRMLMLAARTASIETVLTASESEAFLLENSLIKRFAPRYNINLKDGKSYPVIRLTAEEFPRVYRTRTIVFDGSEYFGPFAKANQIDVYLDLIDRLFPAAQAWRGVPSPPCSLPQPLHQPLRGPLRRRHRRRGVRRARAGGPHAGLRPCG